MELIGKILSNRYEILELIGEGGMAFVYKAKCRLLNRFVAIKVLKNEYSKDEIFLKRFKDEAQSAASLIHPNIVSVFDVGNEDGINYIVMELLESKTLKDYIAEKKTLSTEEALKISMQIASGLEAAHKAGIVHRDIKPQNIVLTKDLNAKVTDFGIARAVSSATITNFGSTMGSVHYFSPEHAKGGFTDEKSDIYSLGIVMYEMATGRVPFDGDSPVSVALKHIQQKPEEPNILNPNISQDLNDIILKAMAKNTVNRYKTASELLHDLNEGIHSEKTAIRSSITSGATQVIPTVDAPIADDIIVPNLRIRNARRQDTSGLDYANIASNLGSSSTTTTTADDEESEIKVKKVKKDKKILIIATVVTLAIIIVFVVVFGIFFAGKMNNNEPVAQEYVVPNLVGRNYSEVVEEYKAQGITISQEKVEFNDLAEGLIISQDLEKGTSSTDREIKVIVSKGPKLVVLPDVEDKDIKVARYELEETLGFKVEVEEVEHEEIAAGIIISQEQEALAEYPYGSTINLKVSKGDGKVKVIMPSVLDKTLDDAKKALEDLKLTVKVTYTENATEKNGIVLSQSYPVNQELSEGDLVEITVNRILSTQTVTLPVSSILTDDNIELALGSSNTQTSYNVKIMASVDGSAFNTVQSKSINSSSADITVELNGYSHASIKVLLEDKEVLVKDVSFN